MENTRTDKNNKKRERAGVSIEGSLLHTENLEDPRPMLEKLISKANAGLLICRNDPHSTILFANDYFYEMIGYTRQEVEELYQNKFAEMVIDDVPQILKKVQHAVDTGTNLDYEYRMKRKDGSTMYIHDTALYEKERNIFYVVIMDVTEKKTIQYQVQKLKLVLEHIPNKIILTDRDGKQIEYANAEVRNKPYFGVDQLEGEVLDRVIGPYVVGQETDQIWGQVCAGEVASYETRMVSEQNTILCHDSNVLIPIEDGQGNIMNMIQVSNDMMSQNDPLTGLPNRGMFKNYYEHQRMVQEQLFAALFIIDIDDFKTVNDLYGHYVGDMVLRRLGKFIISMLGEGDYASRYGGDEFVLLLKTDDRRRVCNCVDRLIQLAQEPLILNDQQITVTYSVGIAQTRGRDLDYSVLFKQADIALYRSKHKGKNDFTIYEPGLLDKRSFEQEKLTELQWNMRHNKELLELKHYKKLDPQMTEDMVGYAYNLQAVSEDLRDLVLYERHSLAQHFGTEMYSGFFEIIIQKYVEQLKEQPNMAVCIYMPAALLQFEGLLNTMTGILEKYGCSIDRIIFTLVDISMMERTEKLYENYAKAREAGFRFMLGNVDEDVDYFQVLMDFPTEFIEIDAAFADRCCESEKYNIILTAILHFMKLHRAKVVLKGVIQQNHILDEYVVYQKDYKKFDTIDKDDLRL